MKFLKKYTLISGDCSVEMKVISPCVRNCCLDEEDVCIGCGRTIEEIIYWGDASDVEKEQILVLSEDRKKKRTKNYLDR